MFFKVFEDFLKVGLLLSYILLFLDYWPITNNMENVTDRKYQAIVWTCNNPHTTQAWCRCSDQLTHKLACSRLGSPSSSLLQRDFLFCVGLMEPVWMICRRSTPVTHSLQPPPAHQQSHQSPRVLSLPFELKYHSPAGAHTPKAHSPAPAAPTTTLTPIDLSAR